MVFHTQQELKEAYAHRLRGERKGVSLDTPVGEKGVTIDILTDSEIVVCKLVLDHKNVIAAKSQLDFYGRFSPNWQKTVATQHIADQRVVDYLQSSGIKVVTVKDPNERNDGPGAEAEGFRYSSEYDYRTFEGGTGSVVAVCAIALILFLGLVGFMTSQQQSDDSSMQPTSSAAIVKNLNSFTTKDYWLILIRSGVLLY